MLILHLRTLPPGAERVNLADVLSRLRRDRATRARAIGREHDPEALAAVLTDDQIQGLTEEFGGQVQVVADTPIDL